MQTPEGYWQNGTYYYYLKDHLGNTRVVINSSGTTIEDSHYYPFGMRFYPESSSNSAALPFRYNGKEFEAMNGLNRYDYGARFYDPALGRWHVQDPLSESYYTQSPYQYVMNNPISFFDPDGTSTHTDSSGVVIAVYDDDDNSVYRHNILPGEYATHEGQTKTVKDKDGNETTVEVARLSGGKKMGETEYWDEFRAHDNETGEVLTSIQGGATIMFGESWDGAINFMNNQANRMGLSDVAARSIPRKTFDIKVKHVFASSGPATGKMLNGKYATARSAGNYLAGMNGATGKFMGKNISLKTYMRLAGAVHSGVNLQGAPYYGEIPYAGRRIVAGFNAGVKRRK